MAYPRAAASRTVAAPMPRLPPVIRTMGEEDATPGILDRASLYHASHMARAARPPIPPVASILQSLEALATPKDLANLQRFGITSANALGISMANVQKVAKQVGRDHATAAALWATGVYEA